MHNKLKLWDDIDINVPPFQMFGVTWLASSLFNHVNFVYRFAISCAQGVCNQVYEIYDYVCVGFTAHSFIVLHYRNTG